MVPVQDGIKLATDIYLPKDLNKAPVIIVRTPYNKSGNTHPYKLIAHLFVTQGYVFVVQDVRGRYKSEGEYEPYQNEGVDGYKTVEWAGKAEWSNGKVALYGFSYLGSCAWLAVPYRSPYLKTIVPMFTTQDIYSIFIERGIFHLKGALYWLTSIIGKGENVIPFKKLKEAFMALPVSELDSKVTGSPIKSYQDFVTHIVPDDFWAKICVSQRMGEIDIPALIVTGWFDTYLQGSIDDFLRMNESPEHSKNRYSHLVIGPWSHNPMQKFPGFEYGKKADFNLQLLNTLHWCDFWLKDDAIALNNARKVTYFLMGKNTWRTSDQWPPKEMKPKKFYLSSSQTGDNVCVLELTEKAPLISSKNIYKYDPDDPVPFRGSHHLHDPTWVGPFEQSELLCRKDMLTYMTPPLEKDLVVVGLMKLIVFVSSDALDTDFCAKISDVQPGGESHYLQAGFLRMRYRESLHMPTLIEPGKVYCLDISLRSIAHVFLKNHRIQLQIASCDFPVHDRNLNTGKSSEFSAEIRVAEQTIYSGGEYPSHLILPVLPK